MQETSDNEKEKKKGCLYIVSTPIGNWDDITLRAMRILKSCDKVICEEGKAGGKLLKQYNVYKDIDLLNEQNEDEKFEDYIFEIASGKRLALISDCGTPVFADPGYKLVKAALGRNLDIVVVPGPSSIMAAIVRSGFIIDRFVYAGFLNRNREDRIKQLKDLSKERKTVVLLETPYRLMPLLDAARLILPYRNAYIGCNLTMPYETHHYGTFSELYFRFSDIKFKGEFTIVFEGLPDDTMINSGWSSPKKEFKPYKANKNKFISRKPRNNDNRPRSDNPHK